MGGFQKFINISEKVMIVAAVLAYIPTTILVFLPTLHTFPQAQVKSYQAAYDQIHTSFIIDQHPSNTCTYREALLNNDYCFSRAPQSWMISQNQNRKAKCSGSQYYNPLKDLRICTGAANQIVYNRVTSNNEQLSLSHQDSSMPIFSIAPPFDSPTIIYYEYVPGENKDSCSHAADYLHRDIEQRISDYTFKSFIDAMSYMWYFCTFLLAVLTVMLVVDRCVDSVNLRSYAMVVFMLLNLGLISLIVYGMSLFTELNYLQEQVDVVANCFIGSKYEVIGEMAAQMDYGLTFGYIFFVGVVCVLLALMVVGELALKILQLRSYQVHDQAFEEGSYELHRIESNY